MSEQQHKDLYGDEVATEVHDIMHQAEEEEERLHPERHQDENMQQSSQNKNQQSQSKSSGGLGSSGGKHESTMDKVKETLHMK